jgi:hypothetical protein
VSAMFKYGKVANIAKYYFKIEHRLYSNLDIILLKLFLCSLRPLWDNSIDFDWGYVIVVN